MDLLEIAVAVGAANGQLIAKGMLVVWEHAPLALDLFEYISE